MKNYKVRHLIMILLLIPLFKPSSIGYFTNLNLIFKVLKLFSILIMCIQIVISRDFWINKKFWGLISFWIIYIINSIHFNTANMELYSNAIASLVFFHYLTIKFRKNDYKIVLDSLEIIFSILIIIHILTVFYINITGNTLFEKIENDYIYFLGTDNYSAFFVLSMCIVIVFNNYLKKNIIITPKGAFFIISTTITYCYTKSVTAASVFIIFAIFMLFYKKSIFNFFSLKKTFILMALLLVFISIFNIQELFSIFLVNIIKKGITLNSRTIIWAGAINLIIKKPFFGYGTLSNDMIKSYVLYGADHAHNIILEIILRTGIFGFLGYLYFISGCINKKDSIGYDILNFGLCLLLLLSFMDFYPTIIMQYVLIGIIYNLNYIKENGE